MRVYERGLSPALKKLNSFNTRDRFISLWTVCVFAALLLLSDDEWVPFHLYLVADGFHVHIIKHAHNNIIYLYAPCVPLLLRTMTILLLLWRWVILFNINIIINYNNTGRVFCEQSLRII